MDSSVSPSPAPAGAGRGRNALIGILVGGVLTALAGWVVVGMRGRLDALEAEGRTVTGRITDITLERTSLRYGGRAHFVHYSYDVGGQRFASESKVTEARARALRPGDRITVTYLPSDPKRSIGTSVAEARERESGMGRQAILLFSVFWAVWLCKIGWELFKPQSS